MKNSRGEIKGEVLLVFLIIAIVGFVSWFIITKKPFPFQKPKVQSNYQTTDEEENNIDVPSEEPSTEPTSTASNGFTVPSVIGGHNAYTDTSAKYRMVSRERYFTLELTQKGKVYITMTKEQRNLLLEYDIIQSEYAVGLELNERNEIQGLSGKVVDIKLGRFGDSTRDSALIFLLEDGTVEYTEFNNLVGNCTSEGKISDLKNIVKIQSVIRVYDDDEDLDSIVAIDSQNNIYDIGEILGI